MTEPEHPSHAVEYAIAVGRLPTGKCCVTLTFTVCGLTTTGIALPPEMATELAPLLAKELINAAKVAQSEDRRNDGLLVIPGLPDALRK